MIVSDLFYEALVKPCKEGADSLRIISGYATSAMAFHHIEELKKFSSAFDVSLLIGMSGTAGLSVANHNGFKQLCEEFSGQFKCSYIYKTPPVHSKVYVWYKNSQFYKAFVGSANYTQNAFFRQREILCEFGNANIATYFNRVEEESIYCDHIEIENYIRVYNDNDYYKTHQHEEIIDVAGGSTEFEVNQQDRILVSLLDRNENIQNRAGLNWGQREGRNPNQAYIQLPPDVYRSEFFPIRGEHFTVTTDDSKTFICTRAQKNEFGAAIETPHNNSLLGEYFRNRLNLPSGSFISKEDLEKYGRTDVAFYKFDDENFFMDFSVNN